MADYKFLDADGLQAVWSIIDAEKVGKKERRASDNAPLGEVFNTYSTNSWEANTASGAGSHAQGQHTTASGQAAHAGGINTTASGIASHADGQNTTASGNYSMAIGQGTEATSGGSLAMGIGTWTDSADGALALGKYNKKDIYNFLIAAGNGTGDQARSNAFTVYSNGNTEISGNLNVDGDISIAYGGEQVSIQELVNALQSQIYAYHQILGVQIDFKNNISQRLAASYDTTTGTVANFNDFDVYSKRTRCTVADDGTINHFFGETGYTEDGSDGQVMVYQPKFYYKVEPVSATKQSSGDGYDLDCANYYISSEKIKGFKIHPAFIDDDGKEVDYYLVAAFDGVLTAENDNSTVDASSTATGYLSSFAAANTGTDENPVYPNTAYASTNLTRSNFEKTAQNRGANWHICTYKIQAAEQLLMMIEFGTMNLQGIENEDDETVSKAIGGGLIAAGTAGVDFKNNTSDGTGTGYRIGLGGSTIETVKSAYNDYTSPIVYRGLENPWGNVNKLVNGIIYNGDDKIAYIANDNSFTDNVNTDYTSCGFLLAGDEGYVSAMGYNENMDWVLLPSKVGGRSTGIVGDYHSQSPGWRISILYGYWNFGSSAAARCGTFCWSLTNGTSALSFSWGTGARAAYCPQKSESSYSANLTKISSLS